MSIETRISSVKGAYSSLYKYTEDAHPIKHDNLVEQSDKLLYELESLKLELEKFCDVESPHFIAIRNGIMLIRRTFFGSLANELDKVVFRKGRAEPIMDLISEVDIKSAFKEVKPTAIIKSIVNGDNVSDGEIRSRIGGVRPVVWEICRNAQHLYDERQISVERKTEIIYELIDSGFEEVSELLEKCDEEYFKKSFKESITEARTALEKLVNKIIENEKWKVTLGFHTNASKLKNMEIIDEKLRNNIGAHYSFLSKFVHEKPESKDAIYGVRVTYENISYLLKAYKEWKNKQPKNP